MDYEKPITVHMRWAVCLISSLFLHKGRLETSARGRRSTLPINDEIEEETEHFKKVSYKSLYRFASVGDKFFIIVGLILAILGGILSPIVNNVFGSFVQTLLDIDQKYCSNTASQQKKCDITRGGELYTKLKNTTLLMVWIAMGQLFCGYGFCVCFKYVSENQVLKTKQKFFESLLRQDIGWHDVQKQSKFISRLVQNGTKIQKATGEGVALCINLITSACFAIFNALLHGFLLTMLSLILIPLLVWVTYYSTVMEAKFSEEQDAAYGNAGAVATEVLGNIRTVISFGGEKKELKRYQSKLLGALKSGIKRGVSVAESDGLSWLIFYTSTAFTLWMGTILIHQTRSGSKTSSFYTSSPENVLIVYWSLVTAAFAFGEGISYFEIFSDGMIAASGFHAAIDRVSEIDSLSTSGIIPKINLVGNIEIRDLHFSYPSRPETEVLKGINLSINAGQTVAFVGHSGCGKSTMVGLLQRFYDPNKGQITFDNYNIKALNVGWFRKQIGAVRQEPVLFNGTISENLRLAKSDATEWEIVEACKQADAHDFIMGFQNGYDTLLGDRGALISGGQKQRIAIARALLTKPSILLLDEATSALDNDSQQAIQTTLEAASVGRTTLIVAHRLVTVKNAHLIIYMKDGQVLERGTHKQLLDKKGAYFSLYQRQNSVKSGGSASSSPGSSVASEMLAQPTVSTHEDDNISLSNVSRIHDSKSQLLEIWLMNLPEWHFLLGGALSSIVQGSIQTIDGILFGILISEWGKDDSNISMSVANKEGLKFLLLAFVAGISAYSKGICFSKSGEELTYRLRTLAFESMINQNVDWFDKKNNHLGALCTRLSGDAALVQGATGIRLGNLLQGFTTVVISVGFALSYSVKLGLMGILFIILLNCVSYLEEGYLREGADEDVANLEYGSMLVTQTITQIRTISSLHIESKLLRDYTQSLLNLKRNNLKPLHIRGLVMGLTQSFTWFAYIILAYYGSHLMLTEGGLTVADIVAVAQFVTFGTAAVAEEISSAPNYYRAKLASARILILLKSEPTIKKNVGQRLSPDKIKGRLEFQHVKFSYPNRPSGVVLNDVSFICNAGQHIAIVGPSGSGKSTVLQLIQRFYDPISGAVKLDGRKLTEIDVNDLRCAIGIVSQEAALFDRSIEENISYGDNSREVMMPEILRAAKRAEIHDFISTLPDRYNTRVGQLGGLLSGGQKQRIAIARALIRNPPILLFDEATSALDAETEEIIQKTLDAVALNRTCITVSHHPAAIRNANLILILDGKGKLIDSGTHSKLMAKSKFYSNLITSK